MCFSFTTMTMLKRSLVATCMLMVLVLWRASAAHAQTVFQLTTDHCSASCGPQISFGTVTLTQDGSNSVLVNVSLLNGNKFINTGLYAFTFDVAGTAMITGLTGVVIFTADPANGGYHQDGFGSFPDAIECTGCGSGGSSPMGGNTLSFVVTESGLTPASFVSNGTAFFTADILSGTTGKTGPVGSITPEPSSMLLFGTGLLVFGGIIRRRRSA